MAINPLDAYQEIEKATVSGRDLEALVLSKASARLQYVRDHWDGSDRKALLDEALRFNQRVWTLFQAEISEPGNPLPIEIKNNLLSLSAFVDKRTFEVMSYPEAEKLDILISINQNIAAGLRNDVVPAAAQVSG